jgi:hypothetical protein
MDIAAITVGSLLQLEDGSTVEVVLPSEDGKTIRARYVDSPFAPTQVGKEADLSDYEITGFTDGGDRADTGGQIRR